MSHFYVGRKGDSFYIRFDENECMLYNSLDYASNKFAMLMA